MTDEQDESQPEPGTLFIYWVPQDADAKRGNTRERLNNVRAVHEVGGVAQHDEGKLIVDQDGGYAEFDRFHIRGWRTDGVPDTNDHRLLHAEPKEQSGPTDEHGDSIVLEEDEDAG